MKTIGQKIKALRIMNDFSQESLGKNLNIDRSMISRWENNTVTPTEENIQLLCDFFHVNRSYFNDEPEVPVTDSEELSVKDDIPIEPETAETVYQADKQTDFPVKESLIVIVLGFLSIDFSPLSLPLSIYNTYYSIKKKCHPIIIFFAIFGILYFINDICFILGHDFFPRINFYYRSGD